MFSRNRPSGPGTMVYIRATTNPGGIGHGWVKDRFITAAPPFTPIISEMDITLPDGTVEKKIRKNKFTLEDFLEQMGQIKKMGGIGKMLEMMPGMGANKIGDDEIEKSEKELKQMEAIIYSMTPAERQNPQILNASRRKRISAGCGQPVSKINNLIKRYEDAKKLMKQLSSPSFMKKNKRFKGLF